MYLPPPEISRPRLSIFASQLIFVIVFLAFGQTGNVHDNDSIVFDSFFNFVVKNNRKGTGNYHRILILAISRRG